MINPLVSVIIPAFNAAALIGQAVNSVLQQGVTAVEVLVVDDGSTDDTVRVVKEMFADARVRLLQHPDGKNHGVCASRRLALKAAQGEFVAFLDADDNYLPGKLERHLERLRTNPEIVLLHGSVKTVGTLSQTGMSPEQWFSLGEQPRVYDGTMQESFLWENRICNSTVICRREALSADDLPDSMVFQFEDWLLWSLMGLRGRFYYDPEPLTLYRIHAGSFTCEQLQKSGTWELAHIEFLLSLFSRLPDKALRQHASQVLMSSLTGLANQRCRRTDGSPAQLDAALLLAMSRTTKKMYWRSRYQSAVWWRVLAAGRRWLRANRSLGKNN